MYICWKLLCFVLFFFWKLRKEFLENSVKNIKYKLKVKKILFVVLYFVSVYVSVWNVFIIMCVVCLLRIVYFGCGLIMILYIIVELLVFLYYNFFFVL